MSLFGSKVILASMKGQFWKSESKSNFKRLSLLKKKKKGELGYERKREEKREKKGEKGEARRKSVGPRYEM